MYSNLSISISLLVWIQFQAVHLLKWWEIAWNSWESLLCCHRGWFVLLNIIKIVFSIFPHKIAPKIEYDMSLFWSLLHLWFHFLFKIIQEIWNLALGTSLLWSRSKMQHTTDVAFNATRFFYTERDDWAILKEVEVMTSNWSNYDTNRCSFWIFEF